MKSLIFSSHNAHKAREISRILGGKWHVITLKEARIDIEIPEPYDTLEENAKQKSTTIYSLNQANCFGEDTGLEVLALNGEPGVRSARYAGEEANDRDNIEKLLKKMGGISDRRARFRTVISLILEGNEYRFEGVCDGVIAEQPAGELGFGYDPVFIPAGAEKTFGEMEGTEKDLFSHRRKALEKMADFLERFDFH